MDILDVKKHYTSLEIYYEVDLQYTIDAWERAYRAFPAGYQETFYPAYFIDYGSRSLSASTRVLFAEHEYQRFEKFIRAIGIQPRIMAIDSWPRFGEENWRKTNNIYPMPGQTQYVNNPNQSARFP